MFSKSNGSLDFIVTYHQSLILVGWLEAGEETDEKIYLKCSDGINVMPEKSIWYFRDDVNHSLKRKDNVKRGFVFSFAEHALQNKKIAFSVGDNGNTLFSKRINPSNINEIDSLTDAVSEFIKNVLKDPFAQEHTFANRIEFTVDHFFWCSRSFFIVSGEIDFERYDKKHNAFTIVAGDVSLSPADMIYSGKKRIDDDEDKGEDEDKDVRTSDGFLLIFEVKPETSIKGFNTCQLQLTNKKDFGYATVKTNKEVTAKVKSEILLSHLDLESGNMLSTFESGIGPALNGLWDKLYASDDIKIDLLTYGKPPVKPKVSIIVPLYGRIDFVMYQMSIFANDSDFLENAELIYVLDDPKQYNTMREYMDAHFPLYRVPCKLIRYDKNLGYAKANNIGAGYAGADLLILMNSDVMPINPNWVSESVKIFNGLENSGVAGITLLFEDQTIQHKGMVFERMPELDNAWVNIHPGKNMIPSDVDQQVIRVPAVTGALLITPKELYKSVGGLDESYIMGDFEDSDYCLKCYEKGYLSYYIPQIEMYHLERQSQSMVDNLNDKSKVTLYNCWKHTYRWNDTIEEVMKGYRNAQ